MTTLVACGLILGRSLEVDAQAAANKTAVIARRMAIGSPVQAEEWLRARWNASGRSPSALSEFPDFSCPRARQVETNAPDAPRRRTTCDEAPVAGLPSARWWSSRRSAA